MVQNSMLWDENHEAPAIGWSVRVVGGARGLKTDVASYLPVILIRRNLTQLLSTTLQTKAIRFPIAAQQSPCKHRNIAYVS